MTTSYAIIGTGAVGGYHGALLAAAGLDVSFLARHDLEHLRAHGLRVQSPDGNIELPTVHVFGTPSAMPRADVVFVAVKATANAEMPAIVRQIAKPEALVVVLQNGLGAEDALAAVVPGVVVAGGVPFAIAKRIAPGTIRHVADRLIELAAWTADGRPTTPPAVLSQLASDLERAKIPVQLSDQLTRTRWRKLAWNIPFSGLAITLRADTRQLVEAPAMLAKVRATMRDVAASAAACGAAVEDAWLEQLIADTRATGPFLPSMRADFDAGLPIEVEAIFGNPLRSAQRAGHPAPLLEELYGALVAMGRTQR